MKYGQMHPPLSAEVLDTFQADARLGFHQDSTGRHDHYPPRTEFRKKTVTASLAMALSIEMPLRGRDFCSTSNRTFRTAALSPKQAFLGCQNQNSSGRTGEQLSATAALVAPHHLPVTAGMASSIFFSPAFLGETGVSFDQWRRNEVGSTLR